MAFATSLDVTEPAGTGEVIDGDNAIRNTREGFRQRLDVDHDFTKDSGADTLDDSTDGAKVGEHTKVTLQQQGSAPSSVADTVILYSADDGTQCELWAIDEETPTPNTIQITKGGYIHSGSLNLDGTTITTAANQLKVADGGIDTTQLAAGAVETAKIADANVTPAKLKMDYKGAGATSVGIPIMAQGYYLGNGTSQTITVFSSNAIQIRHLVVVKSDEENDPITEAVLTEVSTGGGGDATRAWRQHDGLLCDGSDDDEPNGVLRSNLVIGSGASAHQFTVTHGSAASANKWINSDTCQYMFIAYGMLREET